MSLIGLTSTNFAYGFMIANQGLLIAPLEAERLFPEHASLALTLVIMSNGIAQLIGPVVGRWSDLYRAAEGKRLPCSIKAATAAMLLTALLPIVSSMMWGVCFLIVFFLQQLAWNTLQTVQIALVPDFVPVEQQGTAGAMNAAMMVAGAFTGLLAVRFISPEHDSPGFGNPPQSVDYIHYYIGIAFTLAAIILVVLTTRTEEMEKSRQYHFSTQRAADSESNLLTMLRSIYEFDTQRYPEFAQLLFSKACYSANVSLKAFLLYFVQDTFKFRDEASAQVLVGNTAIAAETMAVVAAVLAIPYLSTASATPNASPPETHDSTCVSRAQYAAICGTAWMALLWLGPPAVGYGVLLQTQGNPGSPDAISRHWERWMVAGTAAWGLGQGFYFAGDQTLQYAWLPDTNQASRYLGIAGVWTAIGAVLGAGIAGGLLVLFGGGDKAPSEFIGPGYNYEGYLAVFLFAMLVNAAASRILSTIDDNSSESARILKGIQLAS